MPRTLIAVQWARRSGRVECKESSKAGEAGVPTSRRPTLRPRLRFCRRRLALRAHSTIPSRYRTGHHPTVRAQLSTSLACVLTMSTRSSQPALPCFPPLSAARDAQRR